MATQAEIEAAGVAKEVAANKRRKDAGLPLNAVEYEVEANRRARLDGFKNAAEKEIWHRNQKMAASKSTWPKPSGPTYATSSSPTPTDETAYATTAVSKMPELGNAPTIPSPAQRTVNPQELVEWRMSQMMKTTNPYTNQAMTMAKQFANQSGNLNTSMAASAGVDSALKSMLPIAKQDAATLFSQGIENQRAVNTFLMEDFRTKSEFKLTDFGARVNTYNQGLQQAHDKNENSIQRWWQKEQNRMDRELTAWRDKYDASLKSYLQDKEISAEEEAGMKDCVQASLARWQTTVAALVAEYQKGDMSQENYEFGLTNAAKVRDHEVGSCRA